MRNRLPGEDGELPLPPYTYFYDGVIRRQLHEFGATGRNFYAEVFDRMDYRPGQVVLDVGAGMGSDSFYIANTYHPRIVFLLEPHNNFLDPDDKYYHILHHIEQNNIRDIVLLPPATPYTGRELLKVQVPEEVVTFMQPLAGVAEHIPLPDKSVHRLSMIHSAYEFDDLDMALSEAARVMTTDGMGVLVTNGPANKRVFREMLKEAGDKLNNEAPNTVSSKLDYLAARSELEKYFHDGYFFYYQDQMIIDESRQPFYNYSFDSYRRMFQRPIVNDGRWMKIRDELMDSRRKGGIIRDTIDIGAIFFKNPKKRPDQAHG